ncbi:aromatic aminotransferase ISS1-like [Rhododendron vialii]|uniref:aromatic aminotransferase ISS1-like n=1 Tax=Rhododendron vialii TaxID=182163 RepID=UPI00265E5C40|nr:aromatic aminotransferase ISS1-like [Rhododendron vialii]
MVVGRRQPIFTVVDWYDHCVRLDRNFSAEIMGKTLVGCVAHDFLLCGVTKERKSLTGSYGRLAARVLATDVPVMVKLAELSKSAKDAVPLGQGAIYWQPPEQALDMVKHIALEISTSRCGTHEGLPELREALLHKGFLNLVLSLCDVADSVVLLAPYFFNAYMSFKMTSINNILVGSSDPTTLFPDAVLMK